MFYDKFKVTENILLNLSNNKSAFNMKVYNMNIHQIK